jgi:hypothetical protein
MANSNGNGWYRNVRDVSALGLLGMIIWSVIQFLPELLKSIDVIEENQKSILDMAPILRADHINIGTALHQQNRLLRAQCLNSASNKEEIQRCNE